MRKKAAESARLAMREKEVLVREIHHRVKNNLQIICSLLNLQAAFVKDSTALEILRESQNRVRAMAIVHEQLHRARNYARIDFPEYVANLTTNLFRSYGIDPRVIALKLEVAPVALNIDTAIPCGLIIHELVSNSLRHAFPGGRKGRIQVGLDEEKKLFRLTVRDNGVGFADTAGTRRKSLGLRLVSILAEQIDGHVKRRLNRCGTQYEVRFREVRPREES